MWIVVGADVVMMIGVEVLGAESHMRGDLTTEHVVSDWDMTLSSCSIARNFKNSSHDTHPAGLVQE